jgi:hypothetical protein
MPLDNQAGDRFDLNAQLGNLAQAGDIPEWPVWVHCGVDREDGEGGKHYFPWGCTAKATKNAWQVA